MPSDTGLHTTEPSSPKEVNVTFEMQGYRFNYFLSVSLSYIKRKYVG
jgi:hypothetical protein